MVYRVNAASTRAGKGKCGITRSYHWRKEKVVMIGAVGEEEGNPVGTHRETEPERVKRKRAFRKGLFARRGSGPAMGKDNNGDCLAEVPLGGSKYQHPGEIMGNHREKRGGKRNGQS